MIRVHVSDSPGFDGIQVFVVRYEDGSPRFILQLDSATSSPSWAALPDVNIAPLPTLVLTDEVARSLLDALTRHYQGAEDTRALRRDYDAERGRVDRLIDAVVTIALAEPPPDDIRVVER